MTRRRGGGVWAGVVAAVPLVALLTYSAVAAAPGGVRGRGEGADQIVSGLSGYKRWACANQTPALMPPEIAYLCAVLPPEPPLGTGMGPGKGPHYARWARVYVNEKGRKAFFSQRSPVFPVGTVIVKEKLKSPSGPALELLTVMVKRLPGYDPKAGDWEYIVLDGSRNVQASGKLDNCRSCHVSRAATAYIFRDYLSAAAKAKLK